ncbi:DUF1080 domain-containing protein [Flavobacteriaceae bacterium KMM 6898]|nr:DUF1080 domain-containing protein [Flavobacteriaceae bacterium KMM 6898]
MKYILTTVLVLSLLSCKEKAEAAPMQEMDNTLQEIVYEEYTGVEPTKPEETEIYKPIPTTVQPFSTNGAPSDAIILFDGHGLDQWISAKDSTAAAWDLSKEGSMSVKDRAGDIQTKQNFGSVQLHLEWKSPVDIQREGQNRANSGVFFQGIYEVQILDNNNNDTYVNGQVGSIYKQHVPLAKASVPSGEWNSYDIIFHEPVFNEEGKKIKSGTITAIHNGVLIQDHVEIKGTTPYIGWPKNEAHGKGPIKLQDHGDNSRVSYRNIWVREL